MFHRNQYTENFITDRDIVSLFPSCFALFRMNIFPMPAFFLNMVIKWIDQWIGGLWVGVNG